MKLVTFPVSRRTRKCTPSTASAYFVAMPNAAQTHIQKIAPGPPMRMAVATPPMLPLPTVEASAVDSAWNGVIVPSAAVVRSTMPDSAKRTAAGNRRICTRPVAAVSSPPTMTSTSGMPNGCQTRPSSV